MENGFQKSQIPCMRAAVREVQNSEQTQELRLPDGMPDVGHVVSAWGQVVLRGKEWRSDSISVSGGMLMWVLYAPEDGSEVRVLDGWLPFQLRWTLPEGCREGDIRVTALTRFADARSVSPRKLMLRAGIGVLAEAWVPETLEAQLPSNLPDSVELLRRVYPVRLPRIAGEKEFQLDEELTPLSRPKQLLYYTLKPEITEQKVLANKVAFRGNGNLHALWMGEDGSLTGQDFPMPFSQFAELPESFGSDAQTEVACCVTNLELEIGESGNLHARCGIAAQYLVDDVTRVETVEDAYAPGMALHLETTVLEAPAILEKKQESVSADAPLNLEGAQAMDISFLPDFPRQYREGDGISLEIPGTVQVLAVGDDGNLRAEASRWEGRLNWPMGPETELSAALLAPTQPQLILGGNGMCVHGELPMKLITSGGTGIPMVTELEICGQKEPDPQRPSLILRRAGTDTLWEIAKACGSTMDAIRNANHLSDEPRPSQMLLIPVC